MDALPFSVRAGLVLFCALVHVCHYWEDKGGIPPGLNLLLLPIAAHAARLSVTLGSAAGLPAGLPREPFGGPSSPVTSHAYLLAPKMICTPSLSLSAHAFAAFAGFVNLVWCTRLYPTSAHPDTLEAYAARPYPIGALLHT